MSTKALFWGCSSAGFVCPFGQIWLPRYLMNGLSNFDETYREYLPAPTDNLIRFWRSKVKIAEVYGKNIHVNTGGIEVQLLVLTRVSPVTEDPHDAESQCMLNIPYCIMVMKLFFLLGLAANYRSWRWVWSTVVRRPSQVDGSLTGELSWQHLRQSAVPEIWLVLTVI